MSKNTLSGAMVNCLAYVRDHRDPYYNCVGRSEHGGRGATVAALRSRGLIACNASGWRITEAGRDALAESTAK